MSYCNKFRALMNGQSYCDLSGSIKLAAFIAQPRVIRIGQWAIYFRYIFSSLYP